MNSIEDLYEAVGGLGWYQVGVILIIVSPQISVGWSMLQMSFAGVVPDFYCQTPCTSEVQRSSAGACQEMSFRFLNETLNKCSINGTDCRNFQYDTSSENVIIEWDLVCDKKWAKQTIISVQMAGVLAGTAIAAQLSDLFGRKKVLAGFILSHSLFSISAAFSASWIMFACIRFFAGIGIGGVVVVVFPYVMEFLPLKWRPIASIIPSWTLGVCIFAGMAYWLNNWWHLHIACGLAGIPPFIGICCIPESIRWQAVNGKLKEAKVTLSKIAKHNKKPLPEATSSILKSFSIEQQEKMEKDRAYTYLDLFRRPWTAKISIILWIYWFSLAVAYYGIAFGVASLSGNLYLNIFLLGVMEIPIQTTTFFLNNRFGRLKTTLGFFIATFLSSLGCFTFQLFASGHFRDVAINVLSQLAKSMVGCVWSCVQLWGSEVYPTVIRNLGGGFTYLGARVGGILAPFIINLDVMPGVSYGILCALLFVDCIFIFCLPETRGKALRDTLDQAKAHTAVNDNADEMAVLTPATQTAEMAA